MSDAFLGEVRSFGFGYDPANWAECNGAEMRIVENQALFSLLGTTYGGDGMSTFALPKIAPLQTGAGETGLAWRMCVNGIYPPRQ